MALTRPFAAACALTMLALVAPAAAAQYEPNDNITQAFGPLAAATPYDASIETGNDEDWYVFYTAGQRQLDVAVTLVDCSGRISGENSDCFNLFASLLNTDGQPATSDGISLYTRETEHIRYTAARAARFFINVRGDEGNAYRLQVDPAGALTTKACFEALSRRDRLVAKVRRLRRKLNRAERPSVKRRYRTRLGAAKRGLRQARGDVESVC